MSRLPPESTVTRIAINYRRDDTSPWAGRLYDRLAAEFGRDHVFMDIDALEPGVDFVEEINRAVGESHVLIAVIGPEWATIKDTRGNRRLDNPMDFVRMEIVAALQRNIRVIPVLVGGATMPVPAELPDDVAALARRHAIDVSDLRFHTDVDRLIRSVKLVLERLERAAARASGAVATTDEVSRRRTGSSVTPPASPVKPQPPDPGPPPAPPVTPDRQAAGGAPDRPPKVPAPTPAPELARGGRPPALKREPLPATVLADLIGAGAPASRRWRHWVLLVATLWFAWTVWPAVIGRGAFPAGLPLLSSVLFPLAFVFSAVYCLSVFRSQAVAIASAGVVTAVITNAIAPPPYIGILEYGAATATGRWALALALILGLLALSVRRHWRTWLGLIVAVCAVAAFLDYLYFSSAFPSEFVHWWTRIGIHRALWPILQLSALALIVPRLESRFRGILLAVLGAALLDWLTGYIR